MMEMITDLVLNFSDMEENRDFFEWRKEDSLTYIRQIPIIKIHSFQMDEILTHSIQVDSFFLKQIYHQTVTENGSLDYAILLSDASRVIALLFDSNGFTIQWSHLLLDEEDAVLEESVDFSMEVFSYHVVEEKKRNIFLTREERRIQRYLVNEIKKLYLNQVFDEIHYLYHEISNQEKNTEEEYSFLVDHLENHFSREDQALYEIIQLTE